MAALALLLLAAVAAAAVATTITVTSTGDAADASGGTDACDDGSGACSLRAAIQTANANAGTDTIAFAIAGAGVKTITPESALPTISDPLIVDGYSQPGASANSLASGTNAVLLIELDGTNAGAAVDGLTVTAGGSTIKGLVINRFAGSGIELSSATANLIQGNYLGTNPAGTTDQGNAIDGLTVSSASNTIGGTTPAARNLISGNESNGLVITGATNLIQGNYIGTNAAGTADIPNGPDVFLQCAGVLINGAANNTVGGTTGVTAGGPCTGACNLISGHFQPGIEVRGAGSTGTTIQGNFIGPNAVGSADITPSVGGRGVQIYGGSSNTLVGGTAAGAGNVISGNASAGVEIGVDGTSSGNLVQGNLIGTNAAGTAAMENGSGVSIGTSDNTVGGTAAAARNVISGNGEGIRIQAFPGPDTVTGNIVQGNYIGTDAVGTTALGNGIGMFLIGASDTMVGGTTPGARNIISASYGAGGIRVVGVLADTDDNQILGNYIGTDASGTVGLGNAGEGIQIRGGGSFSVSGNVIGGTASGAGNVIADNQIGVHVWGTSLGETVDSVIQGNRIGVGVSGEALGNSGAGVGISNGFGTTLGGSTAAAGNTIRNNTGPGVVVAGGDRNTIWHNALAANGGLGIDLSESGLLATGDGPTANDPGDGDGGSNLSQNFPTVSWFPIQGGMSRIEVDLDSTPNTTFTVEVFGSAACDAQDHGEGDVFLFSREITTSPSGDVEFFQNVAGDPDFVTATATDPDGNTSEFSTCYPLPRRTFVVDSTGDAADSNPSDAVCHDIEDGCSLRAAIQSSNATQGKDTIAFSIGSGLKTISITPSWPLPAITNAVIIDGTTQPGPAGAHLIRIDGSGGGLDDGLTLEARGSTIRGLVITGFAGAGIALQGAGGNHIENNYIGTDADGTGADPNRRGILIADSPDNVVGGRSAAARNVISGNTAQGIRITGAGSTRNRVRGNFIGTDAAGTGDLGNGFQGVLIRADASANAVGGSSGASNRIAFNGSQGVAITSGTGNAVLENSIHSNGVLGIDLGVVGVLPNDPQDDDDGPNGLQNFPVLNNAVTLGQVLSVNLTLDSVHEVPFRIQVFDNETCDPSGNGEGQRYLGQFSATTDEAGHVTVTRKLSFTGTLHFLTATATDPLGNTSEYSVCLEPVAAPSISIGNATRLEGNSGTAAASFAVTLSGPSPQPVSVDFASANGTAVSGADYLATSGTLTFTPGETVRNVLVMVKGDLLDETNESFFVNLSDAGGATIADGQGRGTITDDDPAPSIRITDISLLEGAAGTTRNAVFTISLSAPSGQTVSVKYKTTNGTATAGSDYVARVLTALTFSPGQGAKTVAVVVRGDGAVEPNETFFVDLSSPTNASIADSRGIGIIRNDD